MESKTWISGVIKKRNDENLEKIKQYNVLFKEVRNILIDENVKVAIESNSELRENTFELYNILKDIFKENN